MQKKARMDTNQSEARENEVIRENTNLMTCLNYLRNGKCGVTSYNIKSNIKTWDKMKEKKE